MSAGPHTVIVGVCDRCGDEQQTTEDACGARPEPVEHRLGSAARRRPDVLAVDARQGREAAVAEAQLQRCGT
ncbi:MAG: hypothetical protein ACRD0W_25020 [Acidimicrobiales bacterium]